MAAFKLITFLFFLATSLNVGAQNHPVVYAGFEYYRNTGFNNNSIGNFNVGAQVYQWKFFAPEIGYDLYFGALNDQNILNPDDPNGKSVQRLEKSFNASLITISPKLKFGKEDAFLIISPKYHIGNVNGKGDYFVLMNNGAYGLEERQKATVPVSFWSFSLGLEGFAVKTDSYWFTLAVQYTFLNTDEAFQKLDFSEYNIRTTFSNSSTIGLGLRFYWDPFAK
ncbi:MAG: hypothetical protein ACQEQB_09520 [Bacteroidota bacterium]